MSIPSQSSGSGFRSGVRGLGRRLWGPVLAVALVALALLVMPQVTQAATTPQGWTLTDSSGHLWGLSLFEQPDPSYPAGWRLRLTARSPGQKVDHQRPMLLNDGIGATWSLPNRSEDLVRQEEDAIPTSSAQFDARALEPRPSDVQPLKLEVPTDQGEATAVVTLEPEVVQALHGLPSNLET